MRFLDAFCRLGLTLQNLGMAAWFSTRRAVPAGCIGRTSSAGEEVLYTGRRGRFWNRLDQREFCQRGSHRHAPFRYWLGFGKSKLAFVAYWVDRATFVLYPDMAWHKKSMNDHKDAQPLLLFKGEAHKITEEQPQEMVNSFFEEAYIKAMACLHDIHVDNHKYNGQYKNEDHSRYLPEFNNLIAFSGERGSGKSSAMVSFRNLLRDWGKDHGAKGADIGNRLLRASGEAKPNVKEISSATKFLCIDPVDPSRFEPSDRLIGSILAELYRRYLQLAREKTESGDFEKQKKLEEAFSRALKGVQLLSQKGGNPFGTPGEAENDFEILRRASDAASMREHFHQLVQAFLRYKFKAGKELDHHYLVIPIDDLDMSVHHAYLLAEDIRKYLMVPNVVILVAMKLDQLRLAVEQANVERFKDYREATDKQRPSMNDIEDMSNLYLEKLVPVPRVVMMPGVGTISAAKHRKLYYGDRIWNQAQSDYRPEESIERVVLAKIKQNTCLCLIAKEGQVHPIVPKTLRELHNFLEFLDGLGAVTDQNRLENIRKFQAYFLGQWVPANLERKEEESIQAIQAAPVSHRKLVAIIELRKRIDALSSQSAKGWARMPAKNRNKDSIGPDFRSAQINIGGDFTLNTGNLSDAPQVYEKLEEGLQFLDIRVNPLNLSLGDLLWHIRLLNDIDFEANHKLYLFAIRTIFSLDLMQCLSSDLEYDNLVDMLGGAVFEPGFAKPFPLGDYYKILFIQGQRFKIDPEKYNEEKTKKYPFAKFVVDDLVSSTEPLNAKVFEKEPFRSLCLATFSFFYFGTLPNSSSRRTNETQWYNQSANLDGGGAIGKVTFDYWGWLFWNAVPQQNLDRIWEVDKITSLSKYPKNKNQRKKYERYGLIRLLQIEVLEAIAVEAPKLLRRTWTNAYPKKTAENRTLWGDIEDMFSTIQRLLDCIDEAQKFEDILILPIPQKDQDDFRSILLGISADNWPTFQKIVEKVADNFLTGQEMDIPNPSNESNQSSPKLNPYPIEQYKKIPSEMKQRLGHYEYLLTKFAAQPRNGDQVKTKAEDFATDFRPFLPTGATESVFEQSRALWQDIHNMAKRKAFALRVLDLIKTLKSIS